MIKTIARLGIDYKVENPYKNYGMLVAKCLEAAKKREGTPFKEWFVYIKPEDVTILPQFVDGKYTVVSGKVIW